MVKKSNKKKADSLSTQKTSQAKKSLTQEVALDSLVAYMNDLLRVVDFKDDALNGLQVDSGNHKISKVGLAVDVGYAVIQDAVKKDCDLLIAHHGLFWKGDFHPLTGKFGEKVRHLIEGGCSLYASHLPLDANFDIGNNIELARLFRLKEIERAFEHCGSLIGFIGKMPRPKTMIEVKGVLSKLKGASRILSLPFGPKKISTVGIVSGGGSLLLPKAADLGLDLYITGEPKQFVYHEARERGINAIFAGHYATETVGVIALGRKLAERFGVKIEFLNHPTNI